MLVTATSLPDLRIINELIHDFWFEIEDMSVVEGVLTIPFKRPPPGGGRKSEPVDCRLVIDRVESWELEDTQEIGRYDFNELRFDPQKNLIRVLTGIPTRLEATVESLAVRFELASPDDGPN